MFAYKIRRPPIRSSYRIKGGCDCKECAPKTRLSQTIAWMNCGPGGWSTVLCLIGLILVALGYYYFWPAADVPAAAALRG